jgi:hypothetical protein
MVVVHWSTAKGEADYYFELAAKGPHRQGTGAECCGSRGSKLKVTTTVFVMLE